MAGSMQAKGAVVGSQASVGKEGFTNLPVPSLSPDMLYTVGIAEMVVNQGGNGGGGGSITVSYTPG